MRKMSKLCPLAAIVMSLSACGGGGGGGVNSMPPPPPPPPPPMQPTDVRILTNPTPQNFASVSVSALVSGSGSDQKLTSVSNADSDQVHIRYSNGGYYEIEMPGKAWEQLGFAKGVTPTDPSTAVDFQPVSAPQNGASLDTFAAKTEGYNYSELAAWFDGGGRVGRIAFGEGTPMGQVPTIGTASYHGVVEGVSDRITSDDFNGFYTAGVHGSVDLNFDFAKGSLDGAMKVSIDTSDGAADLGTFSFLNPVFSAGSTTYSGKFDTPGSGQNYFSGKFTGPRAEETIGAWALPFRYQGNNYQALGAWIAKRQ